jgi:hypothetical protein
MVTPDIPTTLRLALDRMRHDEQRVLQRGAESRLRCYPLCVQLGRGMPEDDQHVVSQRGDLKDAKVTRCSEDGRFVWKISPC